MDVADPAEAQAGNAKRTTNEVLIAVPGETVIVTTAETVTVNAVIASLPALLTNGDALPAPLRTKEGRRSSDPLWNVNVTQEIRESFPGLLVK